MKTYATTLPNKKVEKRFLRKVEQNGGNTSRAIAELIEEGVAPGMTMTELRKDILEGIEERLEKARFGGLEERIEKAVAKVLTQVNGNSRFAGSAIDGYVSRPTSQQADGGDPAADDDSASSFHDSSPDNDASTWQGESDTPNQPPPMSKQAILGLKAMGIDVRSQKKLTKSADTEGQTRSFVLGEGRVEQASYRTSSDYPANRNVPSFLNPTSLQKSDDDPETIQDLAKNIARGNTGEGNFRSEAISKLFSPRRLKKA